MIANDDHTSYEVESVFHFFFFFKCEQYKKLHSMTIQVQEGFGNSKRDFFFFFPIAAKQVGPIREPTRAERALAQARRGRPYTGERASSKVTTLQKKSSMQF